MGNKNSNYIPENIDIISISLKFRIVKESNFPHNYQHHWILYIYCNNKYESKKLIDYVMNNITVNRIEINDSIVQYYEPMKSIRNIKKKGKCKIYCFDRNTYSEGDKVKIEMSINNGNYNYNLTL